MKISNIKINGYGKLENINMQFNEGINIVKGNNESGKSTLLSFISSIFYGASKNKNGKEISDFDKYKPWNDSDFSGKIKYKLDNQKEFEVFRDFKKKSPKIYNEYLEDISDDFNIDKTKGNQFFVDQTGIDENLFSNTMAVSQSEVVLDSSKQSSLIQKITNVISTGDDNVSYKKTIEKLNKKMLEEVGTNRTIGKPINLINDEISRIESEIKDLEFHKNKAQNIDEEKESLKEKIIQNKNEITVLKEIKEYKKIEILELQKISINEEKINDLNTKEKELTSKINFQETKKDKSKKCINPILLFVLSVIIIGLSLLIRYPIISVIIGVILAIGFIFNYINYSKNKKLNNNLNEEEIKIKKELEVIEEAISNCKKEIENDRLKIEELQNRENEQIISRHGKTGIEKFIIEDLNTIEKEIDRRQNEYNILALKENTINIEQSGTNSRIENLVKQVERLDYLKEQKQELVKLAKSINYAQNGIDEAYKLMKNTVTPKFTNKLSTIVNNITRGKYNNVKFSDEEGLKVELENGEYANCNKLSIGTIDQMYLGLRLAILSEISTESMPIILDEAFAYYDTQRLENILRFMIEEYSDKQIVILTCTNRECEILDKMGEKYNLIEM